MKARSRAARARCGSGLERDLFPSALFLFAPYSESVFLLFACGAVLASRRGRYLAAGALGCAAALTRSAGVLLVLPLAVEAVHQHLARRAPAPRFRPLAIALTCSALPAVGTASYLGWWQWQTGQWRRPIDLQATWGRHFSWPWRTLYDGSVLGLQGLGHIGGGYFTLDIAFLVLALGACAWTLLRARPVYAAYAITLVGFR